MYQPHIERESRLILINKLNALKIPIAFLLKNNLVLSVSPLVELGGIETLPPQSYFNTPEQIMASVCELCCGVVGLGSHSSMQ